MDSSAAGSSRVHHHASERRLALLATACAPRLNGLGSITRFFLLNPRGQSLPDNPATGAVEPSGKLIDLLS
ncbi:hypothetical protein BG57_02420 [Caballeronia grimmiae]|uniref:Uncharacterized protein n=1 Tax=Caballeronia grimmiae TaxID=1071679 RepID=A0A069PJI2_9BURK|nr:hypothetical protein BG57_02420 [Caballeronia grimmiae]